MKQIKFLLLAVLISLVSYSNPSFSQAKNQARQHEGFFMRFLLGVGQGKVVIEDVEGSDMEITGTPIGARIQIGGSISENLIVFGEIGGANFSEPTVTWKGNESTMTGNDVSINDYGVGISYYIMPSNIFLSGSLSLSKDRIKTKNNESETQTEATTESGLGFYLSAGKEWWVSDKWALGCAIFAQISNATDKGPTGEYPVKNTVFGIAFSATLD
ncbi:MAG: autotransporter outer membrane beta-barrel domain-containing protein [Calditrichaeota bacterium]|nr:autotransporter outer membrane beta-barrel domain-containing protein [Calditrichota bacterium]